MASIKDIAKKINKAWGEDVLISSNFTKSIPRISMGDIAADYALYGGLPYGQIISFSGVEHSGKTLSASLAMAQYQRENPDKVCIYVDAENTLATQSDFIQKMTGLSFDEKQFLRYSCEGRSAEEIFSDLIELEQADNVGMLLIDSCPALISKADLDNDFDKDNGQRASIAKPLGKFIKQMLMYLPKQNNILLFINQVRITGVSFTGAPIISEPCGYALNYYPSLKIRFGTRNYTQGDKTDLPASKGEDADGFRVKFSIVKSRLGPVNRGGGFLTFRYATGLDTIHDALEIAIKFGFIGRPTVQSYELINLETGEIYCDTENQPLKFIGKQKLIDYLNSHTTFKEEYFNMLTKHISEASSNIDLLDSDDMKEIFSQEAAVNASFDAAPKDEDDEEESN